MSIFSRIKGLVGRKGLTEPTIKAIVKSDTREAKNVVVAARKVYEAERSLIHAEEQVVYERKRLSEYLSAYKRKAEARRQLLKIPVTIKHTLIVQPEPMWQLGCTFDMKDTKTHEVKLGIEGWSKTHRSKDYFVCFDECVKHAQGIAGGTNWEVTRVVNRKWVKYA